MFSRLNERRNIRRFAWIGFHGYDGTAFNRVHILACQLIISSSLLSHQIHTIQLHSHRSLKAALSSSSFSVSPSLLFVADPRQLWNNIMFAVSVRCSTDPVELLTSELKFHRQNLSTIFSVSFLFVTRILNSHESHEWLVRSNGSLHFWECRLVLDDNIDLPVVIVVPKLYRKRFLITLFL